MDFLDNIKHKQSMDEPLLKKEGHQSFFVTAANYSSMYIAFFFYPLRYLQNYNKAHFEAASKGMKVPFDGQFSHLPPLLKLRESIDDDIETQTARMEAIWISYKQQGKPLNLYWLAYLTLPGQVKAVFVSLFFDAGLRLLYSFFMGATIRCLGDYFYARKAENVSEEQLEELRFAAVVYTALMILVILSYIYAERLYFAISFQSGMKLRLIFTSLLYRKLHRISLSALNEVSLGRFINIMSSDLSLLEPGLHQFSIVCIAPFMLFVGLALMWSHFGYLSLLAMGIVFLYMPLQSFLVKLTEKPKKVKNTSADNRIRIMGEIIETIRILKQYTWEQLFMKIAISIREQEVEAQDKIQMISSITTSLSNTSVYVALLITIYFDTIVNGNDLTADKVFSSLLILQIMRAWCVQRFSDGMLFIVNFNIAQTRIIEVLHINEIVSIAAIPSSIHHPVEMVEMGQHLEGTPFLNFENYYGFWSSVAQSTDRPVLRNISLNFCPEFASSRLTSVIGRIGSGKTSLLLSILKEIPYSRGVMNVNGTIAYVEQEPYVFEGSIRDNILFGQEFDSTVYEEVLEASCFKDDLVQMPESDRTYVGERGVTLSGGQRARLSFARALYSQSDIYLLDDPLSAVDAKVARQMFTKGIQKYLHGKIVVLVTHHIHFAVDSNQMVVMHDGKVREWGSPEDVIKALGQEFTQYVENTAQQRQSLLNENLQNKLLSQISQTLSMHSQDPDTIDDEEEEEQQPKPITTSKSALSADMETQVSFDTIRNYVNQGGGFFIFFKIYLLFFSETIFGILANRIFGYWAQDNEDQVHTGVMRYDHLVYAKTIFYLIIIVQVLSFLKFYRIQMKALEIATRIFIQMLQTLVRGKIAYFDQTPSGSIITKFSTDLNMTDGFLIMNISTFLEGFTQLILVTLSVCLVNPIIFLPSVIFLLLLVYIKHMFQPFMSYTRRCDGATRGPINSYVSSTLSGLVVIRAYRNAHIYIEKFQQIVYTNCKGVLGFSRTNTLLSLVLDLSLFFQISVGSALLIMVMLRNESSSTDPGELGFSLFLMIQMGDNFSNVFRSLFLIEINLNHVERMFSVTHIPSEGSLEQESDATVNQEWPQKGLIEFRNVSMRYDSVKEQASTIYALRNINLTIYPSSRVGVVGRTGAGKSSLLQALFRMVEIEPSLSSEGIFIDNINIQRLGLHLLRKRISIIPQQPVVFQGTIRRNLDPLDIFTDARILQALEEVGLKERIMSLDGGLGTDMTISSNVFSVGQKQLICLARAMLQDNKIVVFDEATSNVDLRTDQFIQKKIKERFQMCTVITIAHRLETIADYDRILVMNQGQVAEFDHPFKLLVANDCDQEITRMDGIFASMVQQTGRSASQRIFKVAQMSFMMKLTE